MVHAISPDVCCGHPAPRSLDAGCALAILAPLASNARSRTRATPPDRASRKASSCLLPALLRSESPARPARSAWAIPYPCIIMMAHSSASTFGGPSGNFVGVGLPMQCARGVAGETVPDWFTGGDMLAAGGFCYRMLGWPTGDRLRVAKIPRRLRVPPTGSSRSRIGSIIRAACLPSGSPKRERGVSGSHRDGAGLVRPRTLKGLVAPAPQNPSRPQM